MRRAFVVGQDLDETDEGRFVVARRVAKDRIISTVDPDTRHGHETAARGFDGYEGHISDEPDSEIITDTCATSGNAGDGSVAEELVADILNITDNNNLTTATTTATTTAKAASGGRRCMAILRTGLAGSSNSWRMSESSRVAGPSRRQHRRAGSP